ncbi:MAG: hypothetical protein LBK52_08045 [Deltaproteobacteria bacterium]|jgi:hypothetical protein|nr:hypothetical protein [Deltaproteobacteria bacterium]
MSRGELSSRTGFWQMPGNPLASMAGTPTRVSEAARLKISLKRNTGGSHYLEITYN